MVKKKTKVSPTVKLNKKISKLEKDLVEANKILSGEALAKVKKNIKLKLRILKTKVLVIEKEKKKKLLKKKVVKVKKVLQRKIKSRGKTPSLF